MGFPPSVEQYLRFIEDEVKKAEERRKREAQYRSPYDRFSYTSPMYDGIAKPVTKSKRERAADTPLSGGVRLPI